jgi:hypothetical protein
MSKYGIDLGSLAPGEVKNAHRLYKLPYKVESNFYDMTLWGQMPQGHKLRSISPQEEGGVACCGALLRDLHQL